MDWNNEEVLEFLELYEAHPEIWNPRHPDHKNRNLVYDGWKEIENKISVQADITEIKKKKDSLMATYRKILNKVRVSKGTGSGAEDVYKPDWFAYNAMAFLHGIYEAKKTISSEQCENSIDDRMSNVSEDSQLLDVTEMDASQNLDCYLKNPLSKISKKRKSDDKVQVIENRMDEAYTFFKQMSQTPKKTKCSLYTDLLCVKLEALNEHKQDIAMMEIDNLMFRLKNSTDQVVNPPPSYYQLPSTIFPIYSHNNNYSTSSASSSIQPQPSPEYSMPSTSTYFDLTQNQSHGYSASSTPSPHFQP